jgi:hypothetical protein
VLRLDDQQPMLAGMIMENSVDMTRSFTGGLAPASGNPLDTGQALSEEVLDDLPVCA